MKTAVVYYTRFGHNTIIAGELARQMEAELHRIQTRRQYGFLVMGFLSSANVRMKILPMELDFGGYDLVALCTPIWAWKPAPPARAFLSDARLPRRLAVLFSTTGAQILRAQEKVDQLLEGRETEVVAYGDIDTRNATDEDLRAGARRFAQRLPVPGSGAIEPEQQE